MIKKWQPDKWKHFFVAIPLGFILQFACMYFLQLGTFAVTLIAFLLLAAICYGFELFSKVTGKGHYEMMDAIAGLIGGIIGISIWLIFIQNH